MTFSKEGCKFYIFTGWKHRRKATKTRGELLQVYPDSAPSLDTISSWIRALTAGRTEPEDDHRSGRPPTFVTEATTVGEHSIINEDPTVTLRFLSLELGVSYSSVYDIVHEQLGLRKTCTQWIPHLLNMNQIIPNIFLMLLPDISVGVSFSLHEISSLTCCGYVMRNYDLRF